MSAPLPFNERERLEALAAYELLDTRPEAAFDALTTLAAHHFDVPIALVSSVDADRQWFKSRHGFDGIAATDRDIAFCSYAILHDDAFEVPDAAADPRFGENPLVTADPDVRFYAGTPLIDPHGSALGAF